MIPKFRFIEQGNLFAHDLVEVWKKIPAEHIATLSITIAGNQIYEPHTQFDVFFNGRRLKYMDIRVAENKFLSIFFENIFLLTKIAKFKELLTELTDFGKNWGLSTTTEGETDNNTKLNATNKLLNKNIGANTDNNSNVDPTIMEGLLDIEETKNIPANTISQNKTKENTETESDSKTKTITKGTTFSSNASEDYREFLNLNINNFRRDFYSRFGELFTL